MVKEELDLVIHLGDYIYEDAGKPKAIRSQVGPKLTTIDDYRNRHAQYKTDPLLQAAHAAFPWLVTWDDHELEDNCAGEISAKGLAHDAFVAAACSLIQERTVGLCIARRWQMANPARLRQDLAAKPLHVVEAIVRLLCEHILHASGEQKQKQRGATLHLRFPPKPWCYLE